ncbi:MAG: uroporphyrinogen decarboxylase family protein [Saccharofermentanales bacterium]
MKRRDRILTTLSHAEPDRVPIGFDIFEPLKSRVLNYYGVADLQHLYEKTGIDGFSVWDWPSAQPVYIGPDREKVTAYDRSAAYGFWGKVGERNYPLASVSLQEYRWPQVDHFDFSGIRKELAEIREMDMTTASGHAGLGWLHHVQMRSYDNVFYDIMDDAWMDEYMARNRAFFVPYFKKLFEHAHGMIDIIRADEDLGGQDMMLISPALWRKWYKPLWKEVFEICRQNGARIWMHSCGYCRPLIEDFIEIGVDILNPLPPYVKDSDPEDMKSCFGKRLAFDGGVDQMNILAQGTPEQVKAEVKKRIGQLAPGGGYIIGPSQVLSGDIPFENAIAFLESAIQFGAYE